MRELFSLQESYCKVKMLDFISFTIEAIAIYRLGKIYYWKMYPYFYLKLIVVTVCYLVPRPYDNTWWERWWLFFDPLILLLMLLSIIEATIRQSTFLSKNEFINVSLIATFLSLLTMSVILWLLPAKLKETLDLYIWASRGVHAGMAVGMLIIFIHKELIPYKSFLVSNLHFVLVMFLTISVSLSDLAYPFIETDRDWNIVHYCFQLTYCAILLSWIILIPRAIFSAPGRLPADEV